MSNWPATLPIPTQAYSVSASGRLVVNTFETGFRQRRRYSYNEDSIRVSWLFTQLQLDTFKAFLKYTLGNGAGSFTTKIAGLDGLLEATVYLRDGAYVATYAPHAHWTVTAELIYANPATMGEDLLGILSMEELAPPEMFMLLSDVLFTYIDLSFGDSQSNELVSNFMSNF